LRGFYGVDGAEAFGAKIRERVLSLVALDGEVASRITAAAAALQSFTLPGPRPSVTRDLRNPSIQLVDNRMIKDSPVPDPGIEPGATGGAPAPNARTIRDAIKDLPTGTREKYCVAGCQRQTRLDDGHQDA
jgi:hypothetical protein